VNRIDTVIIGGGQAGLALSRCLSDRDVDHVVLERGRVAERWRTERWDSLRLLTPNWQTRLPAFRYDGPEPDGYMAAAELVEYLERYAASFKAPIEAGSTVLALERCGTQFRLQTTRGEWLARHVVVATGYNDRPFVPPVARRLSRRLTQIAPTAYRNPDGLPDGGVLVVGASSTGVQLAEEIHASGRPVTLAVGRHQRLLRSYRGRDILWWFDALGFFAATSGDVFDVDTSRHQPSLQLVGRTGPSIDIATLQRRGVRIAGRLAAAEHDRVSFEDDLAANAAASDIKMAQMLQRIDAFIADTPSIGPVAAPEAFDPTWPSTLGVPKCTVDLRADGINTVVWATGFARHYPWLKVPVLDERGEIRQKDGVTPAPGLFTLGMYFQRTRGSASIDGVGRDAEFLADRIAHPETFVEAAAS
jgi:putative flavoprotein involved in K+ transport